MRSVYGTANMDERCHNPIAKQNSRRHGIGVYSDVAVRAVRTQAYDLFQT